MQGLIDVEPKVFLDFVGFESKICVDQLNFGFQSMHKQEQIKTTTPELLQIIPSSGKIKPKEKINLEIKTTQIAREFKKTNSKLQINASVCDNIHDSIEFWKKAKLELIQSILLQCRINNKAFLQQKLIDQIIFEPELIKEYNAENILQISEETDCEMRSLWFQAVLKAGDQSSLQIIVDFLGSFGRKKLILPIYKALNELDHALAQETFEKYNKFYHPIVCNSIQEILQKQ